MGTNDDDDDDNNNNNNNMQDWRPYALGTYTL